MGFPSTLTGQGEQGSSTAPVSRGDAALGGGMWWAWGGVFPNLNDSVKERVRKAESPQLCKERWFCRREQF